MRRTFDTLEHPAPSAAVDGGGAPNEDMLRTSFTFELPRGYVDGSGAEALIHKWTYAYPGQHVDGIESWLYPIQPPRS